MFLGLLALAWLAVFAPAVVRARRETPLSSSERFRTSLHMISPRGGRYVLLPQGDRRPSTAFRRALLERRRIARRRRNFALLLLAACATAASAFLGGPGGVGLHLAVDAILGLYVTSLIEARRRRGERARKVRRIERRGRAGDFTFTEPVPARRRA